MLDAQPSEEVRDSRVRAQSRSDDAVALSFGENTSIKLLSDMEAVKFSIFFINISSHKIFITAHDTILVA